VFIQDISVFHIIFYCGLTAQPIEYEAFLKNLLMSPLANVMHTSAFLFNVILPKT